MSTSKEDIAMLVRVTDELQIASARARQSGDTRVASKRMKLRAEMKEYVIKLTLRQKELADERDNALLEKPFA